MKAQQISKQIEGVGCVLFERSSRAQCLSISVRPSSPVRVAMPKGVPLHKAEHFVTSRRCWIHQARIKVCEQERNEQQKNRQLENINQEEARSFLTKRLSQLAEWHGFQFSKVVVRNQKTRWGSCSAGNNISLNIALFLLPETLRDFILLHELVHTRVKNHGTLFWDLLLEIVPDARERQRQMRTYRFI